MIVRKKDMDILEQFKQELFAALEKAPWTQPRGQGEMVRIGRDLLTARVPDLRVFMDTEMKGLVTVHPYRVVYVSCASDKDNLAFLDITPRKVKTQNSIDIISYYYDCDSHMVVPFTIYSE